VAHSEKLEIVVIISAWRSEFDGINYEPAMNEWTNNKNSWTTSRFVRWLELKCRTPTECKL